MIPLAESVKAIDYAHYVAVSRLMDKIHTIAKDAQKRNNPNLLRDLERLVVDWISSINNKGLYSKLPPSHKDYGIEQIKLMNANKARRELENLLKRIRFLASIKPKVTDKGDKNVSNSGTRKAQVQEKLRKEGKDGPRRGANLRREAHPAAVEEEGQQD